MSFHPKSIVAAAIVSLGLAGCDGVGNTGGTVAVSQNRNVLIINNTGRTIWRFYGSRVTTNSWEEDILGSTVLPSGQSRMINFDDGTGSCLFDMKAEFRNGTSIERRNVNVCRVSSVTFR